MGVQAGERRRVDKRFRDMVRFTAFWYIVLHMPVNHKNAAWLFAHTLAGSATGLGRSPFSRFAGADFAHGGKRIDSSL
jgi:hypothetical protein